MVAIEYLSLADILYTYVENVNELYSYYVSTTMKYKPSYSCFPGRLGTCYVLVSSNFGGEGNVILLAPDLWPFPHNFWGLYNYLWNY
jgi:hypothetical protein